MKKVFIQIFLISGMVFCTDSCKKEDKTDPKPAQQLTLDQTEAMQYSTIVVEADIPVEGFNSKVQISGIETDAVVMEEKYIAFMIKQDIPVGAAKLSIQCNGGYFEFPITINELPAINNPKEVITNYQNDIQKLNDLSIIAMDSFYNHYKMAKDKVYSDLVEGKKSINDSLNKYLAKFNKLDQDAQMIAAKIIEANRMQLKETNESILAFNQMIINGNLLYKKGLNISELERQVLNSTKRSMIRLKLQVLTNLMVGSATGALVGAIFASSGGASVIGWKLGAEVGFLVASGFSAMSILEFHFNLLTNFERVWMPSKASLDGALLIIPSFNNDEDTKIKLSIERHNLQPTDISSEYPFVSDYIKETTDFISFVKKKCSTFIKSTPDFKNLVQTIKNVEKLEYISVSVTENNKVTCSGISGTPENPIIRFKSGDAADQLFSYTVTYNDGVFKQSTTYEAVLKTTVNITLRDTTVNGDFNSILFDVIAPPFLSWTFDFPKDWMIMYSKGTGEFKNFQLAIQNNVTGKERSDYVTFTCGTKVIKRKITQTTESCKTLKGNVVLTGKTITASATGGKAPYQYSYNGGLSYVSTNSNDLTKDGQYTVVVKDANGCTDTTKVSLCNVTDLKIAAIGTQSGFVHFTVSYKSDLGVLPEFITYTGTKYYIWFITTASSNFSKYPAEDLTKYCEKGIQSGGATPTWVTATGDVYNRTLQFRITRDVTEMPAEIKFKVINTCNGSLICPNGKGQKWGNEHSLSWKAN